MFDLQRIRALYQIGKELNWKEAKRLYNEAKREVLPAGEYILEAGSLTRNVFAIQKGLVRSFLLKENGDEITFTLFAEHQFFANWDHLFFDRPSRYYFQTLEPTIFYHLDYDRLQEILSRNPNLEQHRKFILQHILKQSLSRMETFVLLSPAERYQAFVAENPQLEQRVMDKYIASILGITPVSLSRIRKRLADQNSLSSSS